MGDPLDDLNLKMRVALIEADEQGGWFHSLEVAEVIGYKPNEHGARSARKIALDPLCELGLLEDQFLWADTYPEGVRQSGTNYRITAEGRKQAARLNAPRVRELVRRRDILSKSRQGTNDRRERAKG